MKRWFSTLVALMLFLTQGASVHARPDDGFPRREPFIGPPVPAGFVPELSVVINGRPLLIPEGWKPYISRRSGRMLFPLRHILEAVGARVDWGYPLDPQARIAWVETPDTLIGMPVDHDFLYFDGEPVHLDQGAELSPDGMTMVPLRHVIERLGGRIRWDAATRTARITYDGQHGARSLREKCALHGYGYESDCAAGSFFAPQVYSGFGQEAVKEMIRHSVNLNGDAVQYLNRIAMMHGGKPPRSAVEAANETVYMLVDSILLAELVGLLWTPDRSAARPGASARSQLTAFKSPDRTGFAHPPGGQHMSEPASAGRAR